MSQSRDLNLAVKPQEFFREKVTSAIANLKIELNDQVEFYLVNLLCEFVEPRPSQLFHEDIDFFATPRVLILKKALESPLSQRLKIFKSLGDTSLYFAGFFQDHFNTKTYDVDYYIAMGTNAYQNVSAIMRDQHQDDHFTVMYNDLSQQFPKLVDVVAEVSEPSENAAATDLLAVYHRYHRSQSERLRRILEKSGIQAVNVPRQKLDQ